MSLKCPKCNVEMSIDSGCFYSADESLPAENAWYCSKCNTHMRESEGLGSRMDKTPVETPVMPGRNGGTLRRGGINPYGNGGRPKSEIRAACAGAFDARIPKLQAIADNADGTYSSADVLKALDMLGKYGGLQQVDQTSGDQALQTVTVVFEAETPMTTIDAILAGE